MQTDEKKQIQQGCANIFGCVEEELKGKSVEKILKECEKYGEVTVYWGCVSEDILNSKF